jgi:hypothetical protein
MTDAKSLVDRILSLEPKPGGGYSEYGSRVMPVIEFYAALKTYEERKGFQDALEQMLTDPRERVRKFAVDVCLGFFGFRDTI